MKQSRAVFLYSDKHVTSFVALSHRNGTTTRMNGRTSPTPTSIAWPSLPWLSAQAPTIRACTCAGDSALKQANAPTIATGKIAGCGGERYVYAVH